MSGPSSSRDLVCVDGLADRKLRLFQFLHSLGKTNELKESTNKIINHLDQIDFSCRNQQQISQEIVCLMNKNWEKMEAIKKQFAKSKGIKNDINFDSIAEGIIKEKPTLEETTENLEILQYGLEETYSKQKTLEQKFIEKREGLCSIAALLDELEDINTEETDQEEANNEEADKEGTKPEVVELNDSLVSKDKGDTVSGARKRKRKRELERMRLWRKSIKQKSTLEINELIQQQQIFIDSDNIANTDLKYILSKNILHKFILISEMQIDVTGHIYGISSSYDPGIKEICCIFIPNKWAIYQFNVYSFDQISQHQFKNYEFFGWIHTKTSNDSSELSHNDRFFHTNFVHQSQQGQQQDQRVFVSCNFTPDSVSLSAFRLTSIGYEWGRIANAGKSSKLKMYSPSHYEKVLLLVPDFQNNNVCYR
uniref:PROCT domain-containing protein n=1 Tax=Meloidogyne enterolobii TaxID=390850 RepID=A0A6V7URX9_MELEN|nr:unnamed protein product [Meloidogyne enterolobii]